MDSSLKNQTEGEGVGGIFHEVGTHLLTLKGYVDDINTELDAIPSLYVSKTGIITDINALSTGTINNTRLQPHAHNSLKAGMLLIATQLALLQTYQRRLAECQPRQRL